MNREADRADELVKYAHDAVADNDFEHAVNLLRKAAYIAPMRKDIKLLLADVLSMPPVAPQKDRSGRGFPAPGVHLPVRSTTAEESSWGRRRLEQPPAGPEEQGESGTTSRVAGLRNFLSSIRDRIIKSSQTAEEVERVGSSARVLTIDESAGNAAVPAVHLRYPARQLEPMEQHVDTTGSPEPAGRRSVFGAFMSRWESRARSNSEEEESAPPNMTVVRTPSKPPKARKSPVVTQVEDQGESTSAAFNFTDLLGAFQSPSPRFITYSAIYGFMLIFVCMAAAVSYAKFFRLNRPTVTVAAAKPDETKPEVKPAEPVAPPAARKITPEEEALNLARTFNAQKRYDDALALLDKSLKICPVGATREKMQDELAFAHNRKGTLLLESNKIAESITSYKSAVNYRPNNPVYRLHLANSYYYGSIYIKDKSSNDYLANAVTNLDKAIELDGKNVQAHQLLATVYENLKQPVQAKAVYAKIRKIAPSSTEAALAGERLRTLSMK